jgi:hypothetical protein
MQPTSAAPERYDEWLSYIFGRTTEDSDPFRMDWIFNASPSDIAELMQCTFAQSGRDLTVYTDRQVSIGLQALLLCNFSDFAHAISGSTVSDQQRTDIIRSMLPLYRECLAKRCPPVLGHRSESAGNPLEFLTYMLWDVSPFDVMAHRAKGGTDTLVDVLAATLRVNNEACVESALHGLGHFPRSLRHRAEIEIDNWLAEGPAVRSELLDYARAARTGCIQ